MTGKYVKALFCMLLLLMLSTQTIFAASTNVNLEVTLVSVELVENNSVGNEWLAAGYVNGKTITPGKSSRLTVKNTSSITFKAVSEEQDKIPDIGMNSKSIKVSKITKKKTSHKVIVTVIENRGRYSGNSAKWAFVFSVKRV
jgi:hypothetical protein